MELHGAVQRLPEPAAARAAFQTHEPRGGDMLRKRYRLAGFVAALSVIGCQVAVPIRPNVSVNSQPSTTPSDPGPWRQASWSDGPGYRQVSGNAGYLFSSGVQVQSDGTVALSRM